MTGVKQADDAVGLFFTQALHYEADRSMKKDFTPKTEDYWIKKSSKETMKTINDIFQIIQEVKSANGWTGEFSLNYLDHYIGIPLMEYLVILYT